MARALPRRHLVGRPGGLSLAPDEVPPGEGPRHFAMRGAQGYGPEFYCLARGKSASDLHLPPKGRKKYASGGTASATGSQASLGSWTSAGAAMHSS
eukprot:2575239-Lingulodinium_polyedra.AAC.1